MTVTDNYLLHRAKIGNPDATVLDLGCGDGRFVEIMLDAGINAYGVDLPSAQLSIESRLARRPDVRDRISYLADPRRIPMSDRTVDVVVSNTVFEHIPSLESSVAEIARVLKPGGRVYAVFPLRSAIMEQHVGLPLFHRIKSRKLRLWYVKTAKIMGLYRGAASPHDIENYIAQHCFYRSKREVEAIFARSFASVESDACAYIEFKGRAFSSNAGKIKRLAGQILLKLAPAVSTFVHTRHAAAYCLSSPK